jgi:hypothetical protein
MTAESYDIVDPYLVDTPDASQGRHSTGAKPSTLIQQS